MIIDLPSKKNVFVGMSGGVDSSVTAAILKDHGYNVTGVYMKNWTQDIAGFECPWMEDYQDAKRVATKLGIEFLVFDFQDQYKQKVVDYMIKEYTDGRTPNPDIMCNQEIKFKLFLEASLDNGADMIATGHYAKVLNGELRVAADPNKDQTYFLYRVDENALKKSLMPIGEFKTKSEVRELAAKYNLPTAQKKDSQGICFVGKVGIKEFLSQYVESIPGPIIDQFGKEIGEHEGAIFYTIGQRHGLNVGGGLPYYVSRKDMKTNTVYVTSDLSDENLWTKTIILENLHWINSEPDPTKEYQVRLRYRGPLVKCKIEKNKLVLLDEQRGLASGQSAVLYEEQRVVGGGIISVTS